MDRECLRCGCTELEPCIGDAGETCAWISDLADVCTGCATPEELEGMAS